MPLGQLICSGGEPDRSHDHSEAGCRLYDPEQHRAHAAVYGWHDPGVCAHYAGSWSNWFLGYPDRAKASLDEALRLGRQLGHPFTVLFALMFGSIVAQFRREPVSSLELIEMAERLAAEQELALFFDPSAIRGGTMLHQDAATDAIEALQRGLAARKLLPNANQLGRP